MAKRAKARSSNNDEPRKGKKLDPIIEGLIARLPASGVEWPEQQRKEWLAMLEQAFKVVYEEGEPPGGHVVTP